MNDGEYSFDAKLIEGKKGEVEVADELQEYFPHLRVVIPTDWKNVEQDITVYDMQGNQVLAVEVKSEDYDIDRNHVYDKVEKKSSNVFMEKYSNKDTKSDGGPFRSMNRGIDLLIHRTRTGKLYIFEPEPLHIHLSSRQRQNPNCYPYKEIPNRGYMTSGHAVPIGELEDAGLCLSMPDIARLINSKY